MTLSVQRRTAADIVRTETVGNHTIHYYRQVIDRQTYKVPTHVSWVPTLPGWRFCVRRLDTPVPAATVYTRDYPSVQEALDVTVRIMSKRLSRTPNVTRYRLVPYYEQPTKTILTGIPGVNLSWAVVFGRNGTVTYNLSVGSTATSAGVIPSRFVGTAVSFTMERLRLALDATIVDRINHFSAGAKNPQVVVPIRRTDWSHRSVTYGEIQRLLNNVKATTTDMVEKAIDKYLPMLYDVKPPRQRYHGRVFNWVRRDLGQLGTVWTPAWVDCDGDGWYAELRLTDGSLYGDHVPWGDDPHAALRLLLTWALVAHTTADVTLKY